MSLDLNTLIKTIKQASVEAVMAKKPMAMCLGEVISINPLKISVDQKMTLTDAQLMLTNAVRDYTVYMTVDHTTSSALGSTNLAHTHPYSGETSEPGETYNGNTEIAGGVDLSHTHTYAGKKKYTVHLGLKAGEKVLLLRCDGGQQFIVLDRLGAP